MFIINTVQFNLIYMLSTKFTNLRKGFTLIELLIVIAILGILAAVVLAALNPAEQLARGRDASRIQSLAGIGHGIQAYATSQGGNAPAATNWYTTVSNSGDVSAHLMLPDTNIVADCSGGTAISLNAGEKVCYNLESDNVNFEVWTITESQSNRSKAGGTCAATTPSGVAAVVYTSQAGRAGMECLVDATKVPALATLPN